MRNILYIILKHFDINSKMLPAQHSVPRLIFGDDNSSRMIEEMKSRQGSYDVTVASKSTFKIFFQFSFPCLRLKKNAFSHLLRSIPGKYRTEQMTSTTEVENTKSKLQTKNLYIFHMRESGSKYFVASLE